MSSSSRLAEVVNGHAQTVYNHHMRSFHLPTAEAVAASEKCHTLTLDLARILLLAHKNIRRELHAIDNYRSWHYLIAHGNRPLPDEIVTDMNPGYGLDEGVFSGHFHGPRNELQALLSRRGAPEPLIALRGVASVTHTHHMELLPPFYGLQREAYIQHLKRRR